MADAALFEFLHTEMVAELWAHHSDPGPGVSAGSRGGEEARAAPLGSAGGGSTVPDRTPTPPLPR